MTAPINSKLESKVDPKVDRNVDPKAAVELSAADLVGHGATFCPNPRMALWSTHPKVFIDVGTRGEGRCPYCGTVYRLKPGEHPAH